MDHPDEMSTAEEFRILMEERPEEAENILERGRLAVATLLGIGDALTDSVHRTNRALMVNPLGPMLRSPDHLAHVAADYGVLYERYASLLDTLQETLSVVMSFIGDKCPYCGGEAHDGDDGD